MDKYSIPRIFFKKYIHQLTSKTFCFLIKLYQKYLDGSKVTYQDLKEQIFDNYNEMEEACSELIKYNIVSYNKIYNKKKCRYKYYLEYLEEKNITFEVVYDIKVRTKHHDATEKYVDNFLSKFPERTREKLRKVIEGIRIYYLKFRPSIKTKLIYDLLAPFFEVDEQTTIKVCNAYLTKHYGKTRIEYIHAILRNEKENRKVNNFKERNLEYFRKKREEEEKKQ